MVVAISPFLKGLTPSLRPSLTSSPQCQQKLWHQLSLLLEDCVGDPDFQRIPGLLIDLYTNFVLLFALRLNALKLAQIAVKVRVSRRSPLRLSPRTVGG